MARVQGSRDADYAAKRALLVSRVRARLAERGGGHPSFRDLATSAGVGQTTLRHYFGDADGLIAAVFEDYAREGAPYLEVLARPSGPFAKSVADAAAFMAAGQRHDVLRAVHATGQAEGVRRPQAGKAYREHILDATLGAVARRLQGHIGLGEVRDGIDPVKAAIVLVAPIVFAFQHQADLQGAASAPVDLDAFIRDHVTAFVIGHRR